MKAKLRAIAVACFVVSAAMMWVGLDKQAAHTEWTETYNRNAYRAVTPVLPNETPTMSKYAYLLAAVVGITGVVLVVGSNRK